MGDGGRVVPAEYQPALPLDQLILQDRTPGAGERMELDPHEFAYRYMTRSGRVDHAEMRRRDPRLARAFEALHPELFA